jgi:hypothetical protein
VVLVRHLEYPTRSGGFSRYSAPHEAGFWRSHAGAELDLLMMKDCQRISVEIKRVDVPKLMPSMKTAMSDLKLDRLVVVYPGERGYELTERVIVVPLISHFSILSE